VRLKERSINVRRRMRVAVDATLLAMGQVGINFKLLLVNQPVVLLMITIERSEYMKVR
jgi:hypothetical protein